jgi:NADPH2:quinone reductase
MKAIAFSDFDKAPEVLELDVPAPEEGEVRVRIHAASVNGFDLAVANGAMNGMMEHRFPVVLGKDFAGVVDALGAGVDSFAVGDRVFGVVTKPYLGDGSFGEYVTVPVAVGLAKIPDSLDFVHAASLGLAGSAAVDAFDAADVTPGSVVLVAGATGGVGNQAVQLALKAGATVIATASTDAEKDQVVELGAAEIVDYRANVTEQVLATHPDGVDIVLHFAGDPAGLIGAVKEGGKFVSTLVYSPDQVSAPGVTVVPIMAVPAPATLERLAENEVTGHSSVTIQRTYALHEVTDAFADFAGGTLGKLVVSID